MSTISVKGLASGRLVGVWPIEDPTENLMSFLRSKGVPIASSCGGDGVCRKCVVNGDNMSCQMSLRHFLELFPDGVVEVDYL